MTLCNVMGKYEPEFSSRKCRIYTERGGNSASFSGSTTNKTRVYKTTHLGSDIYILHRDNYWGQKRERPFQNVRFSLVCVHVFAWGISSLAKRERGGDKHI
jgi:hypothetical protein